MSYLKNSMLYLSRVINTRVEDSADNFVGRLKDILICHKSGAYSPLAYLQICGTDKKDYYLRYDDVEILSGSEIGLKFLFDKIKKVVPEKDCVFLNRDIMDKQIVDLEGARVVRVNDLKMGFFDNKMCVLGIDISFRGLMRRLGIQFFDVFNIFKVNLIDWRKAQIMGQELKLDTISNDLKKLHPADLANIVEDLSLNQGGRIVENLDVESAAKVFEEIEPEMQKRLITHLGMDKASKIIRRMSDDEIVDLLKILNKEEAEDILENINHGVSRHAGKLQKLIKYDDDTAGGLMTTNYLCLDKNDTVEQAVEKVKKLSPSMRSLLYGYVVDQKNDFLGSVSLRQLLVSDKQKKMKDIMKIFRNAHVVRVDQDIDEVMRVITKYNLNTVAVVDDDNKLSGVITVDDVMRCLVPDA
jgi:predicted transcriptional regulator